MHKCQCLLFLLKLSYICYYSVLLILKKKIYKEHRSFKIYRSVAFTKMFHFCQMSNTLPIMTWEKWLILINPYHSNRTSVLPSHINKATSSHYSFSPSHTDLQKTFFALINRTRDNFFHIDPNQSMSSTNDYGKAAISKILPIATNVDLHQAKTSRILLTLHHTKLHYTDLLFRYI